MSLKEYFATLRDPGRRYMLNTVRCTELVETCKTTQQLAKRIRWVSVEVRLMLLDYYRTTEAYEYCSVVRDSMIE